MIKTRNMAEAVRPRPRKQKVRRKEKPQEVEEPGPPPLLSPTPLLNDDGVLSGEAESVHDTTQSDDKNESRDQPQAAIRPHLLPDLAPTEGLDRNPEQTHQPPEVTSLASHLQKHTQEKEQQQPQHDSPSTTTHKASSPTSSKTEVKHQGMLAVVEDPDTPMSRTSSPAVSQAVSPEEAKPLPASSGPVVQEEKSPSLLAQEAMARMQIMASTLVQQTTANSVKESQIKAEEPGRIIEATASAENSEKGAVISTSAVPSVKSKTPAIISEVEAPRKKIGALSLNVLLKLYHNPQLAYNDKFIDDFVQREMKRDSHEFMEILGNYLRARHQLRSVEEDISLLEKKYRSTESELWITHSKSILLQGYCADQAKVQASHTYDQCQLNKEAVSQMNGVLENIRTRTAEQLSLYSYLAQISKLQVESYIHDLYLKHPLLRDVPKNAGVMAGKQLNEDEQYQVNKLKECITILFIFHRKPTKDQIFIDNIRTWTVRLISTLLRLATFSDHLYILNHLLRCPAGVSKWGMQLIQIPTITTPVSGPFESGLLSDCLNHIITAMATVLLPIKAREEFMTQMRVSFSPESIQEDLAWIMVDSDGEEDEDPTKSWLYLHENDVVAILGQFPLSKLFSQVLFATMSETGQVDYDIRRSNEPLMMKIFAFCTVLIQLLGTGLKTYSMTRYKQLNKRLGRLIRQTVSFVSDHWLNFKMHYGRMVSVNSMDTLQAEFDQLFMRATYNILTAQKLGSWQFMADMPYTCVSMDSMWQLLWVLHQGQDQVVNLDSLPSVETCKKYLEDADSWQQLSDNLMQTTTSEAIYLLTTFSNMACCRSYFEQDFINMITLEVFEIAFICSHTREFCSKAGRDLLASIIQTHPISLSFLLARVKEVISKVGPMAIYLFSDLPVGIWQPTDPDMLILRQWLLNFDLLSTENKLARIILAQLNWDVFEQTGRPVIDIKLHRQVALLLVEAYTRFIVDRKAGLFIWEGMKQMALYITAAVSPEQALNNWVWDVVIKLKLHQQCAMWHATGSVDPSFDAPDIGANTWLVPLLKGVTNKIPIACFVALAMTNIGHDSTAFLTEGINFLEVLTTNYQYTTAIYILGCVVPLFIETPQQLLDNNSFIRILECLVVADESLLKSTKSTIMTVEFPGLVTQQLTEMIQAQISSRLALGTADLFISFWIRAMFKACKYFTDKNGCYVMDSLIHWCFVKKGVNEILTDILKYSYTEFCQMCKQRQGIVSSMVSWISASNTSPSFLDSPSMTQFPWLAYMVLMVEGEAEVASGLWQKIQMELHSTRRPNVETALKAAILSLRLEHYPPSSKLIIYRWAQQALETPLDHPLLPVIWQRFFALYLGRQVFESSIAQRASAGERFFESLSYSSMLKRMRNRLQETSKFHMNYDPQADCKRKRKSIPFSPLGSPTGLYNAPGTSGETLEASAPDPMDEESVEYTSSREFHQMLARLYQTFSLWLEEPRLHDGNLYLPALPPQYEASRLNQVFQGFMSAWLEFVDLEGIQYNLSCLAAGWRNRLSNTRAATQGLFERHNTINEPENATARIMRRLRRYDDPKETPAISNVECAVPLINSAIVEDENAFMHLISSDLQLLKHHTEIFSRSLAQHCALDNQYVELVPSLFANKPKTIQLPAECRKTLDPLHRCSNPALLTKTIDVKERNELVHRKIEENRVEYKQLMIELRLPTPLNICVASVHTENAITRLIKLSQKAEGTTRVKKLSDTAHRLFYHMADMVSEESNLYPPTKQFFASCIDILGQEFVSREPDQVSKVLQLCLDKPFVSGLISPHFVPNLCPAQLVAMYSQLLHLLQAQNMDLVFMLLTKFDISKWLESYNPSEADRKLMVEALGSSLMACGIEPAAESQLVFGLYIAHLKFMLQCNFPSNVFMVMNMVFQGSASEGLHKKVWEVFLSVMFSPLSTSEDFDRERIENVSDVRLSIVQITELLEWINTHFMQNRMADEKAVNFGLYIWWARYVPYTSLMFGALIRSYATKVINSSDSLNPYQVLEILWKPLISVFAPWIQPVCSSADGVVSVPWIPADDESAAHVVSTFVGCVMNIYQQVSVKYPENASGIFSLLLMHYMTSFSTKVTASHMIDIFVDKMMSLPWEQLRPDVTLLEVMTKVKEVSSSCCFDLIARILPFISWKDVIAFHISQTPPEVASRMETALGVLLMQAFIDQHWSEDEKIQQLLSQAESFDWSLLTQEGFSCVSSWYLQHRDATSVLAQRSSPLAGGQRLLKQMAGFKPDAVWHGILSTKRMTYIHCITQQLCQVTYLKASVDNFQTAIVNLLSEIEVVEMSVPSVEDQKEESAGMLKQVLGLLNNSNPESTWLPAILTTVTGWFKSSPQTLLLEPCIKMATSSLASLQHMAIILETCIESYFTGIKDSINTSSAAHGWDFIMSIFKVPELNQAGYVNDALSVNAFLVLYCYLKIRVPFCSSVNEEFGFMEEILSICTRSHLGGEDEAKVLLWWHVLLELALKHAPANPTGVINIISRFNSYLATIGQEREQTGFFGALGLGRKSHLSKKMRVLAMTLSTFIKTQINGTTIRMLPGSSHKAASLPSSLGNIQKYKFDPWLMKHFYSAMEMTKDPKRTFTDVLQLVAELSKGFFPDCFYLSHAFKYLSK